VAEEAMPGVGGSGGGVARQVDVTLVWWTSELARSPHENKQPRRERDLLAKAAAPPLPSDGGSCEDG